MGVPDGWSPGAREGPDRIRLTGRLIRTQNPDPTEPALTSRHLFHRVTYLTVFLMILAVAAYFLLDYLNQQDRQESAPAETTPPPAGIVTDEMVTTITEQAGRNVGRPVVVTCPPRIELIRDNQMTCQITEAEGEAAGTLITEAIVTITDPSASQGARWRWSTP